MTDQIDPDALVKEALEFYVMRDVSYLDVETATFQDYVDYNKLKARTARATLAELKGKTNAST